MTQPAINGVTEKLLSDASSTKSNSHIWYRPTISHEHGVYVVLLVSFLTGSALAQAGLTQLSHAIAWQGNSDEES